MSSNNYLLIKKKGKLFQVHDLDWETNKGHLVGNQKTLKDAYDYAKDYVYSEEVEYGIEISDECWED